MAVFRVEKVKDYTIMSNHHLRNVDLSLKAKGLMSLMLSLPEDWDYTLKGLACICRDGVDSISRTIKELEDHGYLTRRRFRYPNGRLGDIEYTIHEQPESKPIEQASPKPESPKRENPVQVNSTQETPTLVAPTLEKPAQLNTKQSKTKKSNTKEIKDKIDKIGARAYRELIERNIEYDILVERYGAERLDAVVELMLEAVVSQSPYCMIAGGGRSSGRGCLISTPRTSSMFLTVLTKTQARSEISRRMCWQRCSTRRLRWTNTTARRSITIIPCTGAARRLNLFQNSMKEGNDYPFYKEADSTGAAS